MKKLNISAAVLLVGVSMSGQAWADEMDDYFKDKVITILSGGTPGGPADLTARIYARFAPKHHPGNPTFIVETLPGGGQLRALQTGMRAPPDGLTVAVAHTRWPTGSILGQDLAPYDVNTAMFIGSPLAVARNSLICADSSLYGSWQDVLAAGKPLKLGSVPGSRNLIGATLVSLMGGPIQLITGYDGNAEVNAAFDRSEVEGIPCAQDNISQTAAQLLAEHRLTPLFYWGPEPSKEYLAEMGATNEPISLFDLPGVEFHPESKDVMGAAEAMFRYINALVLPPDTPENIHQAWIKAYEATVEDPEYLAAMKEANYDPALGRADGFRDSIAAAMQLSPEGKDLFKQIMNITE